MFDVQVWVCFAFLEALILLAVLVAINAVAFYNPQRWDITENKEFSLDPATEEVLSALTREVNVRAYLTSDMPGRWALRMQDIEDKLKDYESVANDKFRLTIVDTNSESFDAGIEGLQIKGIEPFTAVDYEGGEEIRKQGYMGIYMEVLDKSHVIPQITSLSTLDYEVISNIVRLSMDENETGKISITQGNGEPSMDEDTGIKGFVQSMRNNKFTVFSTKLDDKTNIASTVRTLIIPSPNTLTEWDQFVIDQFILRGGNAIFLADQLDMSGEDGVFCL